MARFVRYSFRVTLIKGMMCYEEEEDILNGLKNLMEKMSVEEAEKRIEADPKLKQRVEEWKEEMKVVLKDDINAGICVIP